MPERARSTDKAARRPGAFSLDLVLLAPPATGDELVVFLLRTEGSAAGRWVIPFETPAVGEVLRTAALKLARTVAGVEPAWLEQVGAFADGRRHPSVADLSVAFVGVVPAEAAAAAADRGSWVPASRPPALAPRQKEMLRAAIETVRARLDYSPVAFRLLPAQFTLSDLQQMYELLLGRRLHKASFRRALQAASLVEPVEEWRSEGRGRPAQLFRYAPRKRRRSQRGVRFEMLDKV